jgi:hypothetical protein
MKKLLHPLCILAVVAAPFVLYSIWRTGYSFGQLFEVRLFGTHYVSEVVLLTSTVVACGFCYRKEEKKIFSAVSAASVAVFLARQMAEEYPADYKLWIYIVAPIFVWSLAISSGLMLAIRKNAESGSRR